MQRWGRDGVSEWARGSRIWILTVCERVGKMLAAGGKEKGEGRTSSRARDETACVRTCVQVCGREARLRAFERRARDDAAVGKRRGEWAGKRE